jgi:hypothetical protein
MRIYVAENGKKMIMVVVAGKRIVSEKASCEPGN